MKNLYAKLFTIQNLALAVSKDGTNPHFKSSYPTLDNTISVIIPEINKIGLLVTHFAEGDTFVTRVVDIESGEALDSKYTLLGTTPQQRGSEQTYFRRYSMIALFNLPSEDDDGDIASYNAPRSLETTPQGIKTPKVLAEYIAEIKQEKDSNVIRTLQDEAKQGRLSEKQIAWLDKEVETRLQALKN